MTTERGVVISPPITRRADGTWTSTTFYEALDEQIRHYILYWNKIERPISNLLRYYTNPDWLFLQAAGILRESVVKVPPLMNFDALVNVQLKAFRHLDRKEPGVWSLAAAEDEKLPATAIKEGRGILVTLHKACLVPQRGVPLQDILEFKERRRDELISLRLHLDQIYFRVDKSGDIPLALNSEVEALKRHIDDHVKVAEESGLDFRWSSIGAQFNLTVPATATAVAWWNGKSIPISIASGLAASLSFNLVDALKWRRPPESPFRYISRYHSAFLPRRR